MKSEQEKFLDDVIITAVEGGIGYWSICDSYKRGNDKPTTAEIEELEEDGVTRTGNKFSINREMMKDAMDKALAERMLNKRALAAIIMEDAGDLDADDADSIVQIGCFGRVIFG